VFICPERLTVIREYRILKHRSYNGMAKSFLGNTLLGVMMLKWKERFTVYVLGVT